MIKIKFNNKLLKILLIVLLIFNLGGCMKIGSEKFNNDNKKNYVCIEDYDPQLLVEESPQSLQEFVKNHWDVVKKTVNEFTMKHYGFRSEPTLFEKTGQIQSSPMVYIKSLDHDNLIFSTPAGFSKETNEFYISDTENDLGTIDIRIATYLVDYAYKDDMEQLNNALQSFINENGMYPYSEGLQNKLGFESRFKVAAYISNNEENQDKVDSQLMEYFKNVKYENYSASEIKAMIEPTFNKYETGDDPRYVDVTVNVHNDYDNLDTKILESFLTYCKNKGVQVPAFRFTMLNNYKMCMYTRGLVDDETSRVEFNNKFEITSSSNRDEEIENIKELWGNNKKEVKGW